MGSYTLLLKNVGYIYLLHLLLGYLFKKLL